MVSSSRLHPAALAAVGPLWSWVSFLRQCYTDCTMCFLATSLELAWQQSLFWCSWATLYTRWMTTLPPPAGRGVCFMSDVPDSRGPQSPLPDEAGTPPARPRPGMSNTAAGAILLGVVVLLCIVGWWSSWRPRHPSSVSTVSGSPGESPNVPGGGSQSVPRGSVKIVNRATGNAIWPRSRLQIEPAGDYYKIRWRDQYLAPVGHEAPLLRHVPDSKRAALLWQIKPLGDGFWTITNRGSGQCLEIHAGEVRQSPLRDGVEEQQWRVQPIP